MEDIGIGKRVKAAGLGLVFANGWRVMSTRMYQGASETLDGWTRIISASLNYELSAAFKYLVMHVLMSLPALLFALCLYVPHAQQCSASSVVRAACRGCAGNVRGDACLFCTPGSASPLCSVPEHRTIVSLVGVSGNHQEDMAQGRSAMARHHVLFQPVRTDPARSGVVKVCVSTAMIRSVLKVGTLGKIARVSVENLTKRITPA